MKWLPAALVCLLALPFHPFWPDFEAARRGLLLICAGVLTLGARRWIGGKPDACGLALLSLAVWHGLRTIDTPNPALGIQASLEWLALWATFTWARRHRPEDWLRAGLIAGLLVSGYGLLQALGAMESLHRAMWQQDPDPPSWSAGWLWLQSFAAHGDTDPVSTLGNRNVASEFVSVSSAAAAVLLGRSNRWRLPLVTLAVGACYLIVNQSRSGMIALPVAVAFVLAQQGTGRRGRLLVIAAVLAGTGSGILGHLIQTENATPEAETASESANARPSTIEVRLLIWQGCAKLVAERPLLGHGAGQFAVHYPRVRDQREIDLSTTGPDGPRSFDAAPRSPHQDHLEVLVETGSVGLSLWWTAMAIVLWTAFRCGPAAAAPLVALLITTLVRSPMGNAPAAVLAIGYAGSLRASQKAARAGWPTTVAAIATAALSVWVGVGALMSQTEWASYVRDLRFPGHGRPAAEALDRALGWAGSDTVLRAQRLRLRVDQARRAGEPLRPRDVDEDLDALAALAPYDTSGLLLRAHTAHQLGQPGRSLRLLAQLHELDPRDPAAAVLEATIHMEQGRAAESVAALYRDPHPQLRDRLVRTLAELAEEAERRRRPPAEVLTYRAESAFVAAVDALLIDLDSQESLQRVTEFTGLLLSEGIEDDIRPLVLAALAFDARGEEQRVQELGERASRLESGLHTPHRRLLQGLEKRLSTPAWRAALEK